jgi:hypothetical protein
MTRRHGKSCHQRLASGKAGPDALDHGQTAGQDSKIWQLLTIFW